jgi:hypothetical protein
MSDDQLDLFGEEIAELVTDARAFIREATWTFAKTMAANPHWYRIAHDHHGDDGFKALLRLVRYHGTNRKWFRNTYRAFSLDGYDYWVVWPALNLKPSIRAGWTGQAQPPKGWLPERWYRDIPGVLLPAMLADVEAGHELLHEADYWGIDPDSGVEP